MRSYLLSIICAAFICSILTGLVKSLFSQKLIKLLGGLFMTLCILQPMTSLDWEQWGDYAVPFWEEATQVVSDGMQMASDAQHAIIKEKLEAYILDKVKSLDAELEVEITLGPEYLPVSASVFGEIDPFAKEKISALLETDLGITKEHQRWTGQ